MRNDIYSRQILSESDICDAYLRNPEAIIKNGLVAEAIEFSQVLELVTIPTLIVCESSQLTLSEFDDIASNTWFIPDEYKHMDIAQWALDQCKEDHELQRVGEELILYQERDMFPLLRYCKYLVDVMRQNHIVWGVGRGSSVASYILYLIGIHRINSLHYDLSIDEFLK